MKKIKLKKNHKRENNNKWLLRHLNDEYYLKAKKIGYRSRSAFKLIQINEKFKIPFKNSNILDLGAAPGGWSQVASELSKPLGKVIGIDKIFIKPIDGISFVQSDIFDILLNKDLGISEFDILISDMAPNTSGNKTTDHLRIINLIEKALEISIIKLKKNGFFVSKIFQGGAQGKLIDDLKKVFKEIKYFKPDASRKESSETYLIAKKK